jgi:hypothetical protein
MPKLNLSVLTQKYEHELALFKRMFAQKNEHLTPNKSCGMKRLKKILPRLIWNWNG